jgi:hypothetical protein
MSFHRGALPSSTARREVTAWLSKSTLLFCGILLIFGPVVKAFDLGLFVVVASLAVGWMAK